MPDAVLVTGAFGLVGSTTVQRLRDDGRHVVATDLDTPANREAAAKLTEGRGRVDVRYCDLTDDTAVEALLRELQPAAIIHLAAVIPPMIYANPGIARKVNVGATASLLRAATTLARPPRFVQASSIAVYGARNPHKITDVLTAETPVNPSDIYGAHKVEAEALVRDSSLDWVILRLGGVLPVDVSFAMKWDFVYFEALLPADGRIQTVDVRDVARAFVAATTADAVGETLLIGGDDTHRLRQGDIAPASAAAMGLVRGIPVGRKGDPSSDADWFATDWVDTTRSQEKLGFQHHSWPSMLQEFAEGAGWKRPVLRLIAPLARLYLTRSGPYHGVPSGYADPWGAIRKKWGAPEPEGGMA